jgi:murein DD-endopeptidase MepM/ murein hydrolase activator NlpD
MTKKLVYMALTPIQLAYAAYENRGTVKKVFMWFLLLFFTFALFVYLIIISVFTVIQGNGKVSDNNIDPNLAQFVEFQSFSYKTIYGETWYEFKHPYVFPTLGYLTQGVILDATSKIGQKHIAWDIADGQNRNTEVRAFADGIVTAINTNILYKTTRRWQFCDNGTGICWYEVAQTADVQFACGYEIIIQHSDSLSTQYCHLASQPPLKVGAKVTAGQIIGYQGSTGWATGKHLHFALWRDGQAIDPSYAFSQTSLSNWGE